MKDPFRILTLVLTCVATVSIVGCTERAEDEGVALVSLEHANPPSGTTIDANTKIILTFDKPPANLKVNWGAVTTTGKTVTLSGPFAPGLLNLIVTWEDGVRTLAYTVKPAKPLTDEPIPEPELIPEPEPEPIVPDNMVLIPEGEFRMGSDGGDADPDEQPEHTVYLDAFYIDVHEVTNAGYKQFVLANPEWQKEMIDARLHSGNYLEDWHGNNFPGGQGDRPVRYVSWYAAMAYAEWVGKRLPTEAEWEKAARGRLERKKYPWGNQIAARRANYGEHLGQTTPVDEYPPNDYGVYDMAGNVWEWCLDAYQADFYANSPRENPIAGANNVDEIANRFLNRGADRVIRGGGWNSNPEWLRVTNRHGTAPSYSGIGALGFRCAQDVMPN